jgi:carboxyl-terminal processing protease
MAALGTGYDLSALHNLQRVDALVDQQYVDPERIDYDKMYRAALVAMERQIPDVLLELDAKSERLSVEVGSYRTSLVVQKLTSFAVMESELRRIAAILEEHVDKKEIPFPDIEYAIINGVLSTLDPHSIFLPPEGSKKMEEDNEGEFGGLGITINIEDGQLTIQYPLEDTPAWKAGLQSGDRIVKIEGEGTLNMDLDEAVSKMRGAPDTKITITIMREGFDAPRDFTLVRAKIKPSQVWGVALEGGIGYVRIDQFHAQVEAQLDEVLQRLERESGGKLKGLVLDLRENPGGYLHQAVAVVDRFLKSGTIVSTVERNGRNREEKAARETGVEPDYPMIILMSGTSASASEIVAGALKNQERAAIMGERSFGKGSVQNLYPFSDESRLKLTVARYLTPGDHSIQGIGIPPDIELNGAVVAPPIDLPAFKAKSGPRISIFHRDHYMEEADLEGHLSNSEAEAAGSAVYSLSYLAPDPKDQEQRTDRKDVRKDIEVMLARDVLLATHGSRRADVLKDAERIVSARAKTEETRVIEAFRTLGIDWKVCAAPQSADVEMKLSIGGDGYLDPGILEEVTLSVTNKGTVPLCQSVVKSVSGNDALSGLEYYLGRIEPGQTRSYTTKVVIDKGYPSEVADVALTLVNAGGTRLAEGTARVESRGVALPRYGWSWKLSDAAGPDGKGGDGDGIAEPGELISVLVDVTNLGAGKGGELVVSLKKDGIGKSVELVAGTFTIPDLAPGAKASGTLSFRYVAKPEEFTELPFELKIRDTQAYDYASMLKAGFSAYYNQTDKLVVPLSGSFPSASRETPAITISRKPELVAQEGRVTISGVATDEAGIRDVIIYHAGKKIAYAGGGNGLKSVPFTATAELQDGVNLIVVLVRDIHGMTSTQAVDVFKPPGVVAASPYP